MAFTLAQQKAIALAPKFSGPLSLLCSSLIIRSVRIDMKNGEAGTYHRLLLGLSVSDVLGSFFFFLSTWPIPKGTPGVWGAIGNTQTCTFHGFLGQVVAATPLYNGSLGIYFLLRCRYHWDDDRLKKIEPFLHGVPIMNTLVTAFAGLPLKLFNNANLWCWIAPLPLNCKDSFRYGDEANCIRGDNAWIYRMAFFYVQVWCSILVAMLSMVLIYCTVLRQEKAVDKVQEDGVVLRRQSRRIAHQAFFYMLAFYTAWGAPSTLRLLQTLPGSTVKINFPLVFFVAFCLPMQGFFNFIIFFQSRYLKHKREHPNRSGLNVVRHAILDFRRAEGSTKLAQTATDQIFINAMKETSKTAGVEATSE